MSYSNPNNVGIYEKRVKVYDDSPDTKLLFLFLHFSYCFTFFV